MPSRRCADDTHKTRGSRSCLLPAEELRGVTVDPKRNAHELVRPMVFNGLISNTDDHQRHHAGAAQLPKTPRPALPTAGF